LIQPDPTLFSTVGLSPDTDTNPVGTDHTVTATAQSASGAPVPGATVNFQVISGPNAGKSGAGTTNANGQATFTYTDTGGPGTDNIQAFIGTLASNVVEKIWVELVTKCDADGDGDIDNDDLLLIRAANGESADPDDPRDGNGDGTINVADVRFCSLLCTRPRCATQ
ncbi:MAG TPA: Ig-like domain-containing protein, partial [Vicinamibacterales bacterium]|nr:Ig-like domain-containing protein [Vicinamibacterales bacterium]